MTRSRRLLSSIGRWAWRAVLVVVGLAFVARAVVEVVVLDPSKPTTFRNDWGGPSYPGVLLVHIAPGLAVLGVVAVLYHRRARRRVHIDR